MRLRTVEIEQPYEGMVLFEVELDGETHEVGIDYFDKDRLLDEVVGRCPFVFKMQHLVDGYGLQNVVPGAAMEALQNQGDFRYEGSLQVVPYAAYLREAALSRVCIDLPGNGDMCHRLVDYLALGCCVVRPSPRTRLHVPLEDGLNVRFVSDVASDLVTSCAELLSEPVKIEDVGAAALRYFDAYLHVDQLAGYYVDRIVATLGGGAG